MQFRCFKTWRLHHRMPLQKISRASLNAEQKFKGEKSNCD